jgi:hypothetical protein
MAALGSYLLASMLVSGLLCWRRARARHERDGAAHHRVVRRIRTELTMEQLLDKWHRTG